MPSPYSIFNPPLSCAVKSPPHSRFSRSSPTCPPSLPPHPPPRRRFRGVGLPVPFLHCHLCTAQHYHFVPLPLPLTPLTPSFTDCYRAAPPASCGPYIPAPWHPFHLLLPLHFHPTYHQLFSHPHRTPYVRINVTVFLPFPRQHPSILCEPASTQIALPVLASPPIFPKIPQIQS